MEVRKLDSKDIHEVTELWYKTSLIAHDFISPNHWENNKEAMSDKYLPNSETYLAIEEREIIGFISMVDNYLAAIFVADKKQGSGIGKKLLNFIKKKRTQIQLKVYKKNIRSFDFYKSQHFHPVKEVMENITGEIEIVMEWKRKE